MLKKTGVNRKQIWGGECEIPKLERKALAGTGVGKAFSPQATVGQWKAEKFLSGCLPAKVDTEEGLGESTLLQQALHGGGGTTGRQAGEGQAHDAIEVCIDETDAGFVLAQAKLLVGDLNALDLEQRSK